MSKANYHHGNLKQALLESSLEFIQNDKLENLSLRKLAKIVGVTPTAVYNYFQDKDALIVDIKVLAFQLFSKEASVAVVDISEPEDVIHALGRVYISFNLNNPSLAHLLWQVPSRPDRITPELAQSGSCAEFIIQDAIKDLLEKNNLEASVENIITGTCFAWSQIHGLSSLVQSGAIKCTVDSGQWPNSFNFSIPENAEARIDHACKMTIAGIVHGI